MTANHAVKKVHSGSNIQLDKEKKTHLNALKALFCKKNATNSFKNGEDTIQGGGGGEVLPIMAYMGRLRPRGIPFPGFRYMKGRDFTS